MRRLLPLFGAAIFGLGSLWITGCELSPSDPGKVQANTPPSVYFLNTFDNQIDTTETQFDFFGLIFYDTTLTVHSNVVSYSSVISWYGTDTDGFVDHYQYSIEAIQDTSFEINEWRAITANHIPPDGWLTSDATQDTIVFPAPTLRDRHRLWVRAVDDRGAYSTAKFADFLALTEPPVVAFTCSDDDIADGVCPGDSLFSLTSRTPSWPGITVGWEGEDPDGTIVEYRFYDPRGTTAIPPSLNGIVFWGLDAGYQTIYLTAEDDAGAVSTIPAQRTFHVTVPTFDRRVLVVVDGDYDWGTLDYPLTNAQMIRFYEQAMVASSAVDAASQGIDWDVVTPSALERGVLGQYSNVIWVNEISSDLYPTLFTDKALTPKLAMLREYMEAGGNLSFIGALPAAITGVETGAFFSDRYRVSVSNQRIGSVISAATAASAIDYELTGEPFVGGDWYSNGDPFSDFGLDDLEAESDSLKDVGEGNGYWDGGWATMAIGGFEPAYSSGGVYTCEIEIDGPGVDILYTDDVDRTIGVGVTTQTYSGVLALFPLHYVLPSYTASDVQAHDPYANDPWSLVTPERQDQVTSVLRTILTYTGMLE